MPARVTCSSLLTLLFLLAMESLVQSQQYQVRTASGEKIVHTRVAPVIVHRILPPFYGRHVYQGRFR